MDTHSTHSMLGAQDDLFKERAPPSTTIVNEITIMFALECQHGSAHASPPWFNTRIMLQDAALSFHWQAKSALLNNDCD